MALTSDAKIGIGIVGATLLIIVGGALFANRNSAPAPGEPVENPEVLVREDSPTLGAEDAQVTVVEFGDFECPACGALHPILKQVKEQYADQSVQFVYRHYPLTQHEFAREAAEASEAAKAQGKFWEYHDLLFENQLNLERTDLEQYAQDLGLNLDQFRKDLDDGTFSSIVQTGIADGNAVRVTGTPTVFINNVRYTGQYSVAAFSSAIDELLTQ